MSALRAPFPWFGGKRRVAPEVWERFGDVPNYVEPFFGSGAVLLGRPAKHAAKIETVNDLDGFVANFWRSVAHDPEATARWPTPPRAASAPTTVEIQRQEAGATSPKWTARSPSAPTAPSP